MSNFVTVADGARIFYKDWGTGQPIVFAHGWPCRPMPGTRRCCSWARTASA